MIRGSIGAFRSRLMLLWDIVTTVLAFSITAGVLNRGAGESAVQPAGDASLPGMLEPAALVFLAMALTGLAMIRGRATGIGGRSALLARLGVIAAVSSWVTIVVATAAGWSLDLEQFIAASLLLPGAWLIGRIVLEGHPRERVLLIGSGRVAAHLTALSSRHPKSRFHVIGCLDDDPSTATDESQVVGSLSELPALLATGGIDRLVVCFSRTSDERISEVLRDADAYRVKVDVVPRMFDLVGPAGESSLFEGMPLLSVTGGGQRMSQGITKRALDVVGATLLIVITLPAMAVIALGIKLDSAGPVLYRSQRLGRAGTPFTMLKFRTMHVGADTLHDEHASDLIGGELKRADDPRITSFGRWIRRFSFDELPQLFNVLTGSMSMVGPRPVLVSEMHGVQGWVARRHDVRPGVTGLWQILGRSSIPWDERMQLDYTYARHWSVGFDLKILASTIAVVASRKGAL